MKYVFFTSLAGFLFAMIGANAQIVPIELKERSFSDDVIMENNGTYSTDLSGDSSALSSYVLVTSGYAAANPGEFDPAGALPDDGTISLPGAVFQLQPYSKNNVLLLNAAPGTLCLAPSAQSSYSELSLLVSSLTTGRRSSTLTLTLNYTDGQSITLSDTPTVPELISPPSGDGTAALTLTSYDENGTPVMGSPIYLDEYDFAVSAPPSEILQSVTINPGLGDLQVYALSGIDPAPTPEPRTWLLLLTTLGGLTWAAHRKRVSA